MRNSPWTNVYGYARSVLACGTALTLLLNHSDTLFASVPSNGVFGPSCDGIGAIGIFCMVPRAYLEWARCAAILGLLVTASGWRPRYTGILHWWISIGVFGSATVIDGGDQITAVLTLLLIPVTLTDARRFHWDRPPRVVAEVPRTVAAAALTLARVQVAVVYLHAFTAKLLVEEWSDGTAMYYWMNDHRFGLPDWASFVVPVLSNGFGVVMLTWGSLAVEALLFAGLLAARRHRAWLLCLGVAFHGAIALAMGLISFSMAMIAALILYLREPATTFPDWRRTPWPGSFSTAWLRAPA